MKGTTRGAVVAAVVAAVGLLAGGAPVVAAEKPAQPGADGVVREWLDEANHLRRFFNAPVPVLAEDPELSRRAALHAHYDSVNDTCGHAEDPANPHYTADGDYAAQHSVLWCGPVFGAAAVYGWVRTPYHGEQVLNPRLTVTGFSDADQRSGMDTLTHYRSGPEITQPLTWPNGTGFPLRQWHGLESPDPMDGCPPEYGQRNATTRTGQPFFVYLPEADSGVPPSEVSFGTADGRQLPFCLLRRGSGLHDTWLTAAVLMPLDPLEPGQRYLARYVAGSSVATWDVEVAPAPTTVTLEGHPWLRYGDPFELYGRLRAEDHLGQDASSHVRAGLPVTLLADGEPVNSTVVDELGEFSFTPRYRAAVWSVRFDGTPQLAAATSGAYSPPARDPGIARFAGEDRFSTAVAVSRAAWPQAAEDVFVVTGLDWPDALSAGPAAASLDAPVLPVRKEAVPAEVAGELDRLSPRRAWVVGGEGAVSEGVLAELRTRGIEVTRVSGSGRYETAAAVAARFFPAAEGAYYASGAGYADALGGGAAAAHRGWPLLLTAKDAVPAATPVLGVERIVLGGRAAVSDAVVAQLDARRVAGGDRYATAAAVALDAFESADVTYLATGLNFPDALAGAPAAAVDGAPLLLATPDCVTTATADTAVALGARSGAVLGGYAVLTDRAASLTTC